MQAAGRIKLILLSLHFVLFWIVLSLGHMPDCVLLIRRDMRLVNPVHCDIPSAHNLSSPVPTHKNSQPVTLHFVLLTLHFLFLSFHKIV